MLNLGAILIANNLLNHGFRLAESKRQTDLANQSHQHRLKELAHQQQLGHEYRLDEQIQASSLRCREIAWSKHLDAQAQKTAHQYRLKEITWSNELRLHQELRLRQIAQENAIEIEQIRSQYSVQTAAINRSLIKWEENSPFLEPTEQNIKMLKNIYQSNHGMPLVLIAPFWDDTRTHIANDQGGFPDFRVAINAAWQQAKWFDGVIKCDGYLKRPLRYTDRDIAVISAELADIPVILIHGMVQAGQRIHPAVTLWNILPNQGNSYFQLEIDTFDITKPKQTATLEFQNYVAHYLATIVGILNDAHQLFLTGKRPYLRRYAQDDPEKLKLLANQFALYYDLICYEEPSQEHFYRLDQAIMLNECGLAKQAHLQTQNALTSWYYQKTRKTDITEEEQNLALLAQPSDSPFLTKLADTYQTIGIEDKQIQVCKLLDSLSVVSTSKQNTVMDFRETKSKAKGIIHELQGIAENSVRNVLKQKDGTFQKDLETIEEQIDTQRFVVGVVGVFNTGKSMLLNALSRRELLSTDIIPETASITSFNYGDEDQATVHYWTREEWETIEDQGKAEEEAGKKSKITKMVKEIEDRLGSDFNQFVTQQGRSEEIPLLELKQYTSANADKGYAKLVREVEIRTNLEFCKDNIQIVDTPGLNDPVRLREHITVEKFLPRCDLLLLLLPAKQAFTDFDKNFIGKQLEKGQIHKLFVIVNQIDTLRKKELKTVVDWTRQQIEETFQDFQEQEQLSANLTAEAKGIEIFPVSALESFLNRVPKDQRLPTEYDDDEEEEAKWTDEESGIPAFEERLRKFLFEGERAQEIQKIIQQRLKAVMAFQSAQIAEYLDSLDKTQKELENSIKQVQDEGQIVRRELKTVRREIKITLRHFEIHYDEQVKLVNRNIKDLAEPIQNAAYDKVDEFLNSHNSISAISQVEKWANNTLSPFLDKSIKKEVKEIVSDAEKRIEYLVREVLEEFKMAYQRMEDAIGLNLPAATGGDYAALVGAAVAGIAVGLAGNLVVATIYAHVTWGLAGAFLLTNPVGWAIIAGLAIPTFFVGGKMVKNKIRSRVREELPKQLNKTITEIADNIGGKFKDAKFALMEELRNAAEAPSKEIEVQLQQKEENLQGLLDKKKSQEMDVEKERQAVTQEQAAFKEIMGTIDALV